MMRVVNVRPGSPEWLAHRVGCYNASEAAAMLGVSPHMTRDELLQLKLTGLQREFSDYAQKRVVDPGHRFEERARPLSEQIIGDAVAVLVGVRDFGLSLPLGASLDGIDFLYTNVWEHKRLNDEIRAALPFAGRDSATRNDAAKLPKLYRVQIEQQLMVTGAARVLFSATDWVGETLQEERHCFYTSDPALQAEILAGWKQFEIDLQSYKMPEQRPELAAVALDNFPVAVVRLTGTLTVESNLNGMQAALRAWIDKLPKKPSTDQEFADAAAAVKRLDELEKALVAEEKRALAGIGDVEMMRRLIADIIDLSKTTRLALDRAVEAEKKNIKTAQVLRGSDAVSAHRAAENKRLAGVAGSLGLQGPIYATLLPDLKPTFLDFAGAIKSVSKFDSLRSRIDQKVAEAKIEMNRMGHDVEQNLRHASDGLKEYPTLFPDFRALAAKEPDSFRAIVDLRISNHKAQEDLRRQRLEKAEAEAKARLASPAPTAAPVAAPVPPAATAVEPDPFISAVSPAPAPTQATATAFVSTGRAQAPSVVQMRAAPAPVPTSPPALRMKDINERLGVVMTEAFVVQLGVEPAKKDRGFPLFHEYQFALICEALVAHARTVQDKFTRQAA